MTPTTHEATPALPAIPATSAATAHGGVPVVTDATFAEQVLASGLPVLVEFTADWCAPCRMIAPALAEIAREEAHRLRVVRIDVDTNPATQAAYGVLSMPTLLLFRAGEPVHALVGARPKRRLLQDLAPHL
ncbi:thioredoxin [Actinacidiphila guanduensis]|uniref:Thioredoxin n=1 Tax=Actinacidiphila guanduensis TaxID=310781 RepID=A0A1G9ZV50_9ACTN|nr:thioredoxin [Actinacidiphila guanduensis]SDN24543.1 thioredoxin [Actinacidiphila guanduensis]